MASNVQVGDKLTIEIANGQRFPAVAVSNGVKEQGFTKAGVEIEIERAEVISWRTPLDGVTPAYPHLSTETMHYGYLPTADFRDSIVPELDVVPETGEKITVEMLREKRGAHRSAFVAGQYELRTATTRPEAV